MQHVVSFKLSPEQYDLLKRIAADAGGLTPGQYARFSALQSANFRSIENQVEVAKAEIVNENKVALRKAVEFLHNQLKSQQLNKG